MGWDVGGVVDLLLEPVNTSECYALMAALQGAITGEEATMLTWLPCEGSGLKRAILAESGDYTFASDAVDRA